jgi:hypothetical protein
MAMFEIHNDGPAIVSSNYWDTEFAKAGAVFLSVNAGAFRLLLPDSQIGALADMRTAGAVIVSRGPWPDRQCDDAIEVLFESLGFERSSPQPHRTSRPPTAPPRRRRS